LFTYSPQLWKLLSTVRLTSLELNWRKSTLRTKKFCFWVWLRGCDPSSLMCSLWF
jgi:hypothetical protein